MVGIENLNIKEWPSETERLLAGEFSKKHTEVLKTAFNTLSIDLKLDNLAGRVI